MRIKKFLSGFLALVMCVSSICISTVTSAAATGGGTDVTYYYQNSFDTVEELGTDKINSGGYMAREQVFNTDQTEGYLKLSRGNDGTYSGYLKFIHEPMEAKSMAVEFDISSDSADGVFKSHFRIDGAQNPDNNNRRFEHQLLYMRGTGIYTNRSDMNNGKNPIATIPTDGTFIKLGMIVNVNTEGKLTGVDIYQYDTGNEVWNKIGNIAYDVANFEAYDFQFSVEADNESTTETMLLDNLKVYRYTSNSYDNTFDTTEELGAEMINPGGYMVREQVFNTDQTEGYVKLTRQDKGGYMKFILKEQMKSESMVLEFDVSSDSADGVFKSFFRVNGVMGPNDSRAPEYRLVFMKGTGVYTTWGDMGSGTNPIATIPTDGTFLKLRTVLNVTEGKLTGVDIYKYESDAWTKIGNIPFDNVAFNPTDFQLYVDPDNGSKTETMLLDNVKTYGATAKFVDNRKFVVTPLPESYDISKIEVFPTTGEHPRVMFTESDIPTIKANLTHPENAVAYEMFVQNKNAALDFTDLTSTSIRRTLSAKAFDYVINYDANNPESAESKAALKSGQDAVNGLLAYVRTDMGLPNDTYAVYNCGDIMFVAACVYDWCYDLLTKAEKAEIVYVMEEMAGKYMEIGCPPSKQGAVVGHGSENQLQKNWMALAIAAYDEYPDIYNYVAGRYFTEFVPARNYLFASGGHWQGASYGTPRFQADLWSQTLLCNMNKEDTFTKVYRDEAKEVAYQWIYYNRPDSEYLREGDDTFERYNNFDYQNKATSIMYFLASNFYKDGVLKAEFLENMTFGDSYDDLNDVIMLALNNPTIETQEKEELPLTKYIRSPLGKMVARTGWNMGLNSPDVLAYMNIGETYTNNHHHQDAGNFQIYYKGILASESGAYMNYSEPHNLKYNQSSIAHNTLSITSAANPTGVQVYAKGKSEHSTIDRLLADDDAKTGIVLGQEFGPDTYTPEYTYIAGDIAGAYDATVQEAVRSMLFMPLEDEEYPAAFVVFDRITTTEANATKTFLLHMQSEPAINGNVTVITNKAEDYNGMLTNQTLLPQNAAISKIGGEGQQFMVGGENYQPTERWSLATFEEGWGRVEISTTTANANQTDYMLNVMYVNDADQTLALEEAELIETDLVVGTKIFNRVAVFNKALVDKDSRIGADVTFTIPTDTDVTSYKVNVAGLQAGTWTIKVNGNVVDTQVATEEGGIIYFTAPAGECTISRTGDASVKTFTENKPNVTASIDLRVNSRYVYTTVNPVKEGTELYIPVKALFEALASEVQSDTSGVTIDYLGNVILVTNGSASITPMNGTAVTTTDVKTVDGELLIPASLLTTALSESMTIEWNELASNVEITANKIYDWSGSYPNAIKVKSLFAYPNDDCTPIFNAVDGTTGTSWTHKGNGDGTGIEMGIFDLGQVYELDDMLLAVYQGANGQKLKFAVEVSTDNANWVPAGTERAADNTLISSGTSADFESYDMGNIQARYVKIWGYDKVKQDGSLVVWNAITEVAFLGKAVSAIEPTATPAPTATPTIAPTSAPTATPTIAPTSAPTAAPTIAPTSAPTETPTEAPTIAPTSAPTEAPTTAPTEAPANTPDDEEDEASPQDEVQTPSEDISTAATVTGDDSNVWLWGVLCMAAFALGFFGFKYYKKLK